MCSNEPSNEGDDAMSLLDMIKDAGQWIMDMGKKIGASIDELNKRTNTTGWSDRTLDMNETIQEAVEKEEQMFSRWSQKHADFLYFDAWLMKLSKDQAGEITDAILNIPKGRSTTPLDYGDYIQYNHRVNNPVELESFFRIGDCVFQIPPSFIEVIDQSSTQRIGSIRQNGSIQANQGFANREIVVHIFFNGLDQINGYKVPGPAYQTEHYVDGLRPLMAQFRSAPFLPVENLLLNQTFNIHAVALSSVNVQTVEGFPETLEATLSLIEFDPEPYTNIESSMFAHMIDWDLYRYNYQRFFRELERPGYFPKVTSISKSYPKFDFYSLKTDTIIKSKTTSIGNLYDKSNYVKFLSDQDDVHLTSIQFGLSNLIPSSQMEGYGAPMIQYLGNTDATVSLAFETTNLECISKINDMMQQYRLSAHMLSRYNKVGFLLIDNELIQLTGSRHFVLNTLDTATVPDFPGLYRITMSLTSYNVEPFDDATGGELYGTRPFNRMGTKADAIDNDLEGLHRKVLQDNYIEKVMAERLKLYPDLDLPTLKEVNQAINFIIQFRKKNGLTKYPLTTYPIDSYLKPGSTTETTYSGCVDPDYYVFYPVRYSEMKNQLKKLTVQTDDSKANSLKVPNVALGEAYTIDARMAVIDKNTTDRYYGALPNGTGGYGGTTKDPTIPTGKLSREAYVQLAMSKIGCGYKLGSVGNYIGGKQYFDCTSLIAWCFWQFGEWGGSPMSKGTKPISYDYPKCKFMYQIPISEAKAGDLAWRPGHAGIITGKPLAKGVWETVEAMNPSAGVRLGQFNGYANPYTHVFRPYAFAEAGTKSRSVDVVNAVGVSVRTSTEKELEIEETGGSSTTVKIRTDMRFDSYVTGAVLNKHFKKGMTNIGPMIHSLCKKYNIDPALVSAIAIHETGYGTSSAYVNKNNPGGVMDPKSGWKVVMKFATLDAGFEYMISNLAKNYVNIGLNTIPKIGQKYCPVGAHNDPNNLNVHWVPSVTKYYKEIKATAYDVATGSITLPDAGEYVPGVSTGGAGGVQTIEAQPAIPAYGEIAINMPYEWKQAQAGQTLHNKVVQYKVNGRKYTCTKKTKVVDTREIKSLQPQTRAPLAIDDEGNAEVSLEGYNGYKNNVKPYLSSEKKEYHLYQMPGVKTGQSKVSYQNDNFGRPLVIKTPILRALEKAGKKDDLVPSAYFKSRTFEGESFPYTSKKKKYSLTTLTDDDGDSFRWFERAMIEEMTGENMFSYMCVDMVQGNSRGRLCRAFPTFVFSIIDSNGEWLDGRKLWSNYYFYRSVLDIKVFQESEQPIHTAQITVSNTFDRLGKAPTLNKELYNKTKIENDPEYGDFLIGWYKLTGSLIGTPKLTNNMVELKNQIWNTIDVKEGCRIHIRMGYGSNPSRLMTTFNGVIAEVEEYGDQLRFTAQSDGAELLSQVMSTSDTEKNGLFKFQCETSNIVASVLTDRINKFTNSMYKGWGEPSKYGIESFGLPIGKIGLTPTSAQDQLDLTKNIYLGRYKPYLFTEHLSLFGKDGEDNFQFRLGGKYAWDVFQQCAQILPEFVCQPVYHQFESRIFYGLPFFPVRYRYDIGDSLKLETWTESCKTFAQFHMVTSSQDIILNKMKASKRNFSPNAIGLYTSGSGNKSKKTPVLYSDRTMDWSKQSTKVYDTTIVQNLPLLDDVYEFLGIRPGRTQATNICKSNLIEQWKQTYKGEVVIIGDSTIKPLDYVYIEDTTKNVQGLSTVRSVVHSISGDTGFTTSYVPGLIAIDADSHSGAINVYKGAIAALGLATSAVNAIKLGNQWSKAGKALSGANVIRWMAREAATPETIKMLKSATSYVWSSVKTGSYMAGEIKAFNSAKQLFNTSTTGIKLKKGVNTVKNMKAIKTAFTTGKAAVMAATNTVAPIIGPIIVGIVSQIAVNTVLDAVFDYLEYKNCVKVLPLYKNGRPFCISTSGAQHLIVGASSNAITNDEVNYDVEDEEIDV